MADEGQPISVDEDVYFRSPSGFFAQLRETRPVAAVQIPGQGRRWVVTRYEDVRAGLADPQLSKDLHHWPTGPRTWPSQAVNLHAHMLHRDPPDHTRLRGLMLKAFTPRRIAQLRPRTVEIAETLLADMASAGGEIVDLLIRFARPLPITVLSELLGVPAADRAWLEVAVVDYDNGKDRERVIRELAVYFTDLITAKRAEPGDDLVSALVRVRDESDAALTDIELLSGVFQLVMAGFDTTVNLIASGTLALLTHPEQAARLREEPSLLPAAVEELLRHTNPLNHATERFTLTDVVIGGVTIPAGEWVLLATSSANGDPGRFPAPERLDFNRQPGGHVSFGHGIHYCLGAPLARLEAQVAFGALLTRFPKLSLAATPEDLRWRPVSLMHGLEALPVRPHGPSRPTLPLRQR
ncbi:cytochrome P450 [Kutzneria sp. NPDC052558]|uniref:cytochrome P450 n=1 Tax=Kutzneria sp. NPDC052558 TaxID=3364121 RepID=UPI0037CA676D